MAIKQTKSSKSNKKTVERIERTLKTKKSTNKARMQSLAKARLVKKNKKIIEVPKKHDLPPVLSRDDIYAEARAGKRECPIKLLEWTQPNPRAKRITKADIQIEVAESNGELTPEEIKKIVARQRSARRSQIYRTGKTMKKINIQLTRLINEWHLSVLQSNHRRGGLELCGVRSLRAIEKDADMEIHQRRKSYTKRKPKLKKISQRRLLKEYRKQRRAFISEYTGRNYLSDAIYAKEFLRPILAEDEMLREALRRLKNVEKEWEAHHSNTGRPRYSLLGMATRLREFTRDRGVYHLPPRREN